MIDTAPEPLALPEWRNRSFLYLPSVSVQGPDVAMDPMARQLAQAILGGTWQRRKGAQISSLLTEAAQAKADSMATLDYIGHSAPDGTSANANVRAHGYVLPAFYPEVGNSVESLGAGYVDALGEPSTNEVLVAWRKSPAHWAHVSGEPPFYSSQTFIGVGYARPKPAWPIFVFLSAP